MLKKLYCNVLYLAVPAVLTGLFISSPGYCADIMVPAGSRKLQNISGNNHVNKSTRALADRNLRLLTWMSTKTPESYNEEKPTEIRMLIDSIKQSTGNSDLDSLTISDAYYLLGICDLFSGNNHGAVFNLESALNLRKKTGILDVRYGRALYNLGMAYGGLGDYSKMEEHELKSLELLKNIYGESNPVLISTYLNLIAAYIELQEYEKAINLSNIALAIADRNQAEVKPREMVDLYADLGVCYNRLADFSKALIYLEKSEAIYLKNKLHFENGYINIINSMAVTYGAIGLTEKSLEYYSKGVAQAMAVSGNSSFSSNIVNSYAISLGNSGEAAKGESLLRLVLGKANLDKEKSPRLFFEVLCNYATFLQEFNINIKKSQQCFASCINYLSKNPKDILLRYRVVEGYSLSLVKSGEPEKAIGLIQDLLSREYGLASNSDIYNNPDIEFIKADKPTLRIFKTKYQVLCKIFEKTKNLNVLDKAANTSEVIVSLLDKIRINISEEDSRLILGDRYRESYFNAIRDFNFLYIRTSDRKYLEKAFEYSEKSKVAGLLTSTRELKAVQLQIPQDIAEFEFRLKRDIGSLHMRIIDETNREKADNNLINSWNEKLLEDIRLRDSLILVFEKKYPGYFKIKYNTQVASMEDIPHIVGRDGNYLNYLLSDTILYIFVANRKYKQILAIPVDTGFYDKIRQFRNLLSIPEPSADALTAYNNYQTTGIELYKTLIAPVRPYLISNKLIISPDNILSYIPFETLPTAMSSESRPYYRTIQYMMDDFDISYTYSATFMAESVKENRGFGNKLLAFAPNYSEPIDVQSILMSRQVQQGVIHDLPYARKEAEYVTDITGGTLFENSAAKKSVYRREAGQYNIIHLAMHTILDDKRPMYSTLIFSPESDNSEDRYLKTYEVYGIPLKAEMVVLSACNSGSGFLFSGEGILSLARGFIYSGSQSVVMSMWEIEDRSGTEIVKMFYDNLKKGYTKSGALRKARIDFLKNSDQLRSHPYFWSALVVYGDNGILYYTRYAVFGSVIFGAAVIICLLFYFRKRRYS
jgi:CHAT domain-containing protein